MLLLRPACMTAGWSSCRLQQELCWTLSYQGTGRNSRGFLSVGSHRWIQTRGLLQFSGREVFQGHKKLALVSARLICYGKTVTCFRFTVGLPAKLLELKKFALCKVNFVVCTQILKIDMKGLLSKSVKLMGVWIQFPLRNIWSQSLAKQNNSGIAVQRKKNNYFVYRLSHQDERGKNINILSKGEMIIEINTFLPCQ